ncbi:ammonium transporter MEPa [Meredithblackwellia eburnea MCA 4105]
MVNVTYDASGSIVSYWDGPDDPQVYNPGDIAWILASAALVMIMCPGVGYLYSGLLRRKNALSMLYLSFAVYSVVTFQWFFWGYSLTFSETASPFIGDLKHFGMIGVLDQPSPGSSKIPAIVFAIYQSMFAAITPILAIGGSAERGRLGPLLIFAFMWATLVYDPVATWTWNPNGWGYKFGALDFAGGGPVHMTSGTCSLVMGIYLGKRRGYGTEKLAYRPHSVSHVVLGTVMLWFGWFGFNGGSALAANFRAAQASFVTNLAAAVGGLTWLFIDYIYTRKWSAVALCSGCITGLIGITPAAGYVGSPAAVAIGVVTVVAANYATKLKHIFKYDDALDVFATHGIGGFVGALLTGLFADSRVTSFDGLTEINGGWINKYYRQLGIQLANAVTIVAYTAVMTLIILVIIDYIPGCSLRASEEAEIIGIDEDQCGEAGYDYAYINRDVENPTEHAEWVKEKSGPTTSSNGSITGEPKEKKSTPELESVVVEPTDRTTA